MHINSVLTEQETRYLNDLERYYRQVMVHPQRVWAKHPKPRDYGLDSGRAQQLIAQTPPISTESIANEAISA